MTDTLTSHQLEALEGLGWEFMPTGPDEWQWLKFDDDGEVLARQGDIIWKQDIDQTA